MRLITDHAGRHAGIALDLPDLRVLLAMLEAVHPVTESERELVELLHTVQERSPRCRA